MKVAVLLYNGVEELDFAGPYEVFGQVAEVFTVAPSLQVKGRHGLKVTADFTFTDAPQPDVLVVPGGPITREDPASLTEPVAYVQRTAPRCRMVLSVCTGAFLMARAGLLDDRSCTTHWRRRHLLAAQFPDVKLRYARVVADGKIVTTAGVAAGIDGSLFTVSRLWGVERAGKLAKQIEYPWHSSHTIHEGSMPEPEEVSEGSDLTWA
jgi:transcriptional regulator GlxA family with amidase domain